MTGGSIDAHELDNPHLIRREESVASHRLAKMCFGEFVADVEDEDLIASYKLPRRGGTQVICHQGVPVSQISIYHSQLDVYGSPLRIGSIGGVCTHPDYRGLGLATRLLDYCTRKLTDEGARLMLISGMRGLYARAGCVTAQDLASITLKPGQIHLGKSSLSLRRATEADLPVCARLYQAEAVHFVRRVEEFAKHFRQREEYPQAEDWIVDVAGYPVAYLFTSIPWEYLNAPNARVREVFEYAGSRVALFGGVSELIRHSELKELRLFVPWQDVDLLQLVQEHGITGDRIPLGGHTMRVVNFPGLMADLRAYVRARLTARQRHGLRFEQAEDQYSIVRGQERLELDGAAMTRLVMGIPAEMWPDGYIGGDVTVGANVSIAPGTLSEIIPALFSLPSFLPGLNYR